MSTIITQAKKTKKVQEQQQHQHKRTHLPEILHLNLRDTRIDVDKNTLVCFFLSCKICTRKSLHNQYHLKRSIPETVLRILFPHGLLEDAKEYKSDFDPNMFAHIIDFNKTHKSKFLSNHSQFNEDAYLAHAVVSGIPLNPLLTKQGIVVLLEELVYFVICDKSSSIKQTSLKLLLDQDSIFDADRQEQDDFVDLLCLAGFNLKDKWQVRSQEPNLSSIHSIALANIEYDDRLRIGQKMMMFHSNPTVRTL